jgi:hypothetical protein
VRASVWNVALKLLIKNAQIAMNLRNKFYVFLNML